MSKRKLEKNSSENEQLLLMSSIWCKFNPTLLVELVLPFLSLQELIPLNYQNVMFHAKIQPMIAAMYFEMRIVKRKDDTADNSFFAFDILQKLVQRVLPKVLQETKGFIFPQIVAPQTLAKTKKAWLPEPDWQAEQIFQKIMQKFMVLILPPNTYIQGFLETYLTCCISNVWELIFDIITFQQSTIIHGNELSWVCVCAVLAYGWQRGLYCLIWTWLISKRYEQSIKLTKNTVKKQTVKKRDWIKMCECFELLLCSVSNGILKKNSKKTQNILADCLQHKIIADHLEHRTRELHILNGLKSESDTPEYYTAIMFLSYNVICPNDFLSY